MRKIKFRGKRIDNGEWVYGYLFREKMKNGSHECFVISDDSWIGQDCDGDNAVHGDIIEVIPETVGQYTCFEDKNGVDIYEEVKAGGGE